MHTSSFVPIDKNCGMEGMMVAMVMSAGCAGKQHAEMHKLEHYIPHRASCHIWLLLP